MDDHDDIAVKATVAAQERLRAILAGDLGRAHPELAEALAFETTLSTELALKLLEAAEHDRRGQADD